MTMTESQPMPAVLSIAGSDSCGGAGIQADLKTFTALGVDGATALTAVTAQNRSGVRAIQIITAHMVAAQLDAVFEEMDIRAVKLGMLADVPTITTVAAALRRYRPAWIVLDPVMVATSGARLLGADAIASLCTELLPMADCLTPNLPEAAALLGTSCATTEAEMAEQGRALLAFGSRAVLMKGGHAPLAEAVDLLVTVAGVQRYVSPRIQTGDLHGTGCMLSAAVAAWLARGGTLTEAVGRAKTHLSATLARR